MFAFPLFLVANGEIVVDEHYNDENYTRCGHGMWNSVYEQCDCYDGWKVAGPTDTFAFLQGKCTQSMCTSNSQCVQDLYDVLSYGDDAICVHAGWNCYCGWHYAWMNGLTGAENENAKCMGVLYVLSVSGGRAVLWFIQNTWRLFAVLSLLCLPLGQTHVRCQHRNPDTMRLLQGFLKKFCYNSVLYSGYSQDQGICDGRCSQHPISNWFYTFAWSIYVLDFMVVLYALLAVLYALFLISWAIAMWLVVAAIIVIAAAAAAVAAVIGSCGCSGENTSGPCCDCPSCSSIDNCCDCSFCGCCEDTSNLPDIIFYDAGDFYNGSISTTPPALSLTRRSFCGLCRPLAWIISKFPRAPANAWGGFLGLCMGTTEGGTYEGGNCFVDFLAFRPRNDAHDDTHWRDAISAFIYSYSDDRVLLSDRDPMHRPDYESVSRAASRQPLLLPSGTVGINALHGKTLIQSPSPFTAHDNVTDSCFEDYKKNECWICRACNSNRTDIPADRQWHLWVDCGHMYCHQCSSEIARRRMPCPLCRRCSSRIKEGPCFQI